MLLAFGGTVDEVLLRVVAFLTRRAGMFAVIIDCTGT
jgi:hypothetical protein